MAFQPRTRCPEHSTSSAQIMGNSPPMVILSGASATTLGKPMNAMSPRRASAIVDDDAHARMVAVMSSTVVGEVAERRRGGLLVVLLEVVS